jgi:glucose-6-phosphate isomerase
LNIMSDNTGVKIDFTNVMGGDDAAHLVSEAELSRIEARVTAGHEAIEDKRKSGMIGFHDLPEADISDVLALAEECAPGCEAVVVLGIGGSSLGTTAVATALLHPWHNVLPSDKRSGRPRLFVIDNIDSAEFATLLDMLHPETTLFNVISKSGETAETSTQFLIATEWLKKSIGDRWTERVIVTTGPDETASGQKLVQELGLRWLPVPPNVGGRFSVLTPVGLFPLAMVGVDVKGLLAGAAAMRDRCVVPTFRDNPAYTLGTLLYLLDTTKDKPMAVLMPYSQALRDVSDWFRQLWAESLGKIDKNGNHVGQTPIKALGVTDQHSQLQLYIEGPNDKAVMFLTVDDVGDTSPIPESLPVTDATGYLVGHTMKNLMDAEKFGTEVSLTQDGRPNLTISLPEINANTVGQVLMLFEAATAMAGELYEINAFNQPGVQRIKDVTHAVMGHPDYTDLKEKLEQFEQSRKRFTV